MNKNLAQKQARVLLPLSASPFPNNVSTNRKREMRTAAWKLQENVGLSRCEEVRPGELTGGDAARECGETGTEGMGEP